MKRIIVFVLVISLFLLCGCKAETSKEVTQEPVTTTVPNTDPSQPGTNEPNATPGTDATNPSKPQSPLGDDAFEGPIDIADPEVTEPDGSEPLPTDPEATQPEGTEPDPTDPEATKPEGTEPDPTDPEESKPVPTEPDATKPLPTDPKPSNPGSQGGNSGGSKPIELPMIPG